MCFYSQERSARGYSGEELVAELEKNGVIVLADETVLIDDRFYLIGREDAGYGVSTRREMDALMRDLAPEKFTVVLDQQPSDYAAEEAAGADLVLSGHTHGGQFLPLAPIMKLVSSNDLIYGLEKRGDTTFIVTSGLSDWAIRFKTGCRSEYNIIDVISTGG